MRSAASHVRADGHGIETPVSCPPLHGRYEPPADTRASIPFVYYKARQFGLLTSFKNQSPFDVGPASHPTVDFGHQNTVIRPLQQLAQPRCGLLGSRRIPELRGEGGYRVCIVDARVT